MKSKISIISVLFLLSCTPDDILLPVETVEIPSSLSIDALTGIKLESTIVSEEVRMNVKLPYSGEYRIKIRDIGRELISQEKINADKGDNLLSVYVSSLTKDSYTIELCDNNGAVLGITSFVVQ